MCPPALWRHQGADGIVGLAVVSFRTVSYAEKAVASSPRAAWERSRAANAGLQNVNDAPAREQIRRHVPVRGIGGAIAGAWRTP